MENETLTYLAFSEKKMSYTRRVISRTMQQSLAQMAQLTAHTSFNAAPLLALRTKYKNSNDPDIHGITINDMLLYAVAQTVKNYPILNAHLVEEKLRYFSCVNLGMAVDTPNGLLVPTLFEAEKKSLRELSLAAKEAVSKIKSGKVTPDDLSGGTFTVSNLGSLGIECFTPIVNPPQTAILGVCTSVNRIDSNGKPYPAMGLSLTFDHRAIDGAPAARYLKELCDFLACAEDTFIL